MTEAKAKETIKDIVKRRILGVCVDGEQCPIKYSVAQNAFRITVFGRIKSYRRNELVALLIQEAERLQRYQKLIGEEQQ